MEAVLGWSVRKRGKIETVFWISEGNCKNWVQRLVVYMGSSLLPLSLFRGDLDIRWQ